MFVRHEVSKTRPDRDGTEQDRSLHGDCFARLVAEVAADPWSAYNIERYLWVLEEPLKTCHACGAWFDPCFAYGGGPAHGLPRRYCSPRCAWRAAEQRRRERLTARRQVWGRAA